MPAASCARCFGDSFSDISLSWFMPVGNNQRPRSRRRVAQHFDKGLALAICLLAPCRIVKRSPVHHGQQDDGRRHDVAALFLTALLTSIRKNVRSVLTYISAR